MEIEQKVSILKSSIPEYVEIIAVTKTADADDVNCAISCGITAIGESRIQEAEDKLPKLLSCKKHFIGHLQSNKAKKAVELFDCIQSVDSIKLAEEINKQAINKGKIIEVFIEVNIGREQQKSGVLPQEVGKFYNNLIKLSNLKVTGIMCIPPNLEAEKCRPYFREMKKLQQHLGLKWCSMGMSNDYKVAIEEGSNMVRIGRLIFSSSRSL